MDGCRCSGQGFRVEVEILNEGWDTAWPAKCAGSGSKMFALVLCQAQARQD